MKVTIVNNSKREIVDMEEFKYYYIPMTNEEKDALGLPKFINYAWRISK